MIIFFFVSSIKMNFENIYIYKIMDYDIIIVKDCGFYSIPGEPVLPLKILSFKMEGNRNVKSISIIKEEWKELNGRYKLFPGQNPFPLSLNYSEFLEPDSVIYNSTEQYPEKNLILLKDGIRRGERIVNVIIFPLRYIPKERKVYLLTNLEFNMEEFYSEIPEFHTKRKEDNKIEEIIITKGEFIHYFEPLKIWKRKKGVNTEIFNLDSIIQNFDGNSKPEKIRNFIKWAYTNLMTDYVLLGGQGDYENNQEILPRMDLFYKSSGIQGIPYDKDTIPSDMYYSNLDGDWNFDGDNVFGEIEDSVDLYADVYVGRAPCKDTNDVKVFVNKVINYEMNPPDEYIRNLMLPAELLYSNYWGDTVNNYISIITQNYMNSIRLYQSHGNYYHDIVKSTIQSGIGFAHYASHGNAYGTSKINIQDIDALTNDKKLGLHTGISCLTGAIDYVTGGDCFAEHIVLNPYGGGISAIMNTRYGWGYIPGLGPSETIDTTIFYNLFKNDVFNLGKLNSLSKEPYVPVVNIEDKNGYYRWCMYELMLFGDPEMPLWTKVPDSIFANFKKVIQYNDTLFEVYVKDRYGDQIKDARVCLYRENEIYDVKRTDESGFTIFKLPNHSNGFMNITITKDNFIPLIDSVYLAKKMKILIIPDSIPINSYSDISVQIGDEFGFPVEGVEVMINAEEINLVDTTDNLGIANFYNVYTPYGEYLSIIGRDIKENKIVFQDSIKVYGGDSFQEYYISGGSALIGITGNLMKNIKCEVKTFTIPEGHKTFIKGSLIDTSVYCETDTLEISFIPLKDGIIYLKICKEGFDIQRSSFVVKDFKGFVSGSILDLITGRLLDAFVTFYGYDTFSCNTNLGYFTLDSLICGLYKVKAESFGYYTLDTTVVVRYPDNFYNLKVVPKPISFVSGYVRDKGTHKGILSEISLYNSNRKILTIFSDTNGYFSFNIPYEEYKFVVKAYGFKTFDTTITISNEITEFNVELYPAIGNILIINDDSVGNSPNIILDILSIIGYNADFIGSDSASKILWDIYDIVIISCGSNREPLKNGRLRKMIKEWNGKMIIEGGDLGYYYSWDDFGKKVMHIKDWKGNNGGRLIMKDMKHPIVKSPNLLPETLYIDYKGWSDQDICVVKPDADIVFGNENYPDCAGIIVFDNTPQIESGKLVYFAFNFERLGRENAHKLLENTINYLYNEENMENAKIRFFCEPIGTENNAVFIKVYWDDKLYKMDTTDTLGETTMFLYEGNYDLIFSKDGYSDTLVSNFKVYNNEETYLKINLYPFIVIYSSDFDSDSGGLIPSGDWEWGEVSYVPDYAFSGKKCWGTSLNGEYSSNSNSVLETPEVFLPEGKKIKFSFYMWFLADSFYDGGNVKISMNNGFGIIEPLYPYYNIERISSWNRGIPKEKGWTGNKTEWQKVELDLSKFAGDTIKIRWHFGSDYIKEYSGWYIDNVVIGYTEYDIIEDPEKIIFNIPGIMKDEPFISIYSNKTTDFSLVVFDILGRVIGKKNGILIPKTNKINLPLNKPGIFFIAVKAGNTRTTKKIIIIK